MSDLRINNITDRTGGSGPVIAGVSTVTGTGAFTVPVGPTEMRGGRGRGLFSGGYLQGGGDYNTIEKVEIATTGNATDFGDMGNALSALSCVDNSVRGVFTGGANPSGTEQNHMTYVQIATTGDASDFGDLINATRTHMSTSNGHGGL